MKEHFDWNNPNRIKICSTLGDEFLPERTNKDNAGIDIRTPVDIVLAPAHKMVIDTGLIIDVTGFNTPLFTMIIPRSSAGFKYGLELCNSIGIIDRNYCGPEDTLKIAISRKIIKEVVAIFDDLSDAVRFIDCNKCDDDSHVWGIEACNGVTFVIDITPPPVRLYKAGERFAQMIVTPYLPADVKGISLEDVKLVSRGGIGSTGVE